jgi:GNAT superfamily N-acetyltransferase
MMIIDRHPEGQRIADIHRMIETLCRDSDCGRWWSTDAADVMDFIHECRLGPFGYCSVAVDIVTEETAGCLLGFSGELPFNRSVIVAREVILWVEHRYRGRSIGEKLSSDFSDWSKSTGATLVSIGSTYGFGEEHIKKIADSLGFELQETMYLRKV